MAKKEESPVPEESQFIYGGKVFFIKSKDIPTVLPELMRQIRAAKKNKGKKIEGEK